MLLWGERLPLGRGYRVRVRPWVGELAAGTEIRIVAETGSKRAKPSNIAKVGA